MFSRAMRAFTPRSSRTLNCPSNLIGHDHPNKPANGTRSIRQSAGGLAIGLADALDEAWWGAKFLAKMQNPKDGSMRGDVRQGPDRTWMKWTAPDVHTDNQIGTADDPVMAAGTSNVPLTIAAWAAVARRLSKEGIDSDYLERR